ncbi:MAG: PEP-CTERM sorting domain-containing protein [Phenylobacterium sp.]|uniref:PEPxxWA-CTERM sorting domain-containing protein n=1 Tax=Phenylobacterium sp. TaxID=1871053 RepID=UPI001203DC2C|nr:PEPxxWA-CTERM sorting domain-containing protein [Phenylobacterium sp.]TAL28540.1 MAG: PEP-CTERM sorting domain-containing protein [Phenylobacterium sp.]
MRTFLIAAAAMAAMTLGASQVQAATVLNVGWTTDCGKSTCFDENGQYRQTFSRGAFSGPVSISQLLMDRGVLGTLDGKTFRLSFQLNDEELGTWGQYNMGGIGGDQLWFGGEQFTWNPEDGDLVLVLQITPPPKPGAGGGLGGFALREDGDGESAPFDGGDEGDGGQPGGREPVAAVPEPSTWAMMIIGFGLAGALIRRRAVVLAQP